MWRRRPRNLDVSVVLRTGDSVDLVARYIGTRDGVARYVAELPHPAVVAGITVPLLPARAEVVIAVPHVPPPEGAEG